MNPSNVNQVSSGIPSSTDMNSNFSFNSPSIPRSGLVFTKSRVSKRRTINRPTLKPGNPSRPGVNPFLHGSEYSSVIVSPRPVGSASVLTDIRFRSKDSAESLTEGVVGELRSLKLGVGNETRMASMNPKPSLDSVGGNNESSRIPSGEGLLYSKLQDDLRKLNIQVPQNKASEKNENVHSNMGINEERKPAEGITSEAGGLFGMNMEMELPDVLQTKLNITGSNKPASGSRNAVENLVHMSNTVPVIGKYGNYVFAEMSVAGFSDQMKNLNLKDSASTTNTSKKDDFSLKTQDNANFSFRGRENTSDYSRGVTENLLSNEMDKKLSIGSESTGAAATSYAFSANRTPSQASGNVSHQEKKDDFNFTTKQRDTGVPFVEFTTPASKVNLVSGFSQKVECNSKKVTASTSRLKKTKGKLKQPTHVQPQLGQDFISIESTSQEPDASVSYSPMDVSPYQEILVDNRSSREASVTSNESFGIDLNFVSTDSEQPISNDAVDEELVSATERMDIQSDGEVREVIGVESTQAFAREVGNEGPSEGYLSGAETESFKSANDEIDFIRDDAVTSAEKTEANCSSNLERKDSEGKTEYFSCSQSEETVGSNFTFSASSAMQGQYSALKRNNKKKSSSKPGHSSYHIEIPHPSSSFLLFSPTATSPLPLLPPQLERGTRSTSQSKGAKDSRMNVGKDVKPEYASPTAAIMAAQEACEKWRLRGNQAYTSGDMSKAEDCYTQGINCIAKNELSRSCLRALMLCYSNRAATRMSLGRLRDALGDCMMATEIDPNFFRVLLRVANCYLGLGEIEDALQYYKKCLQASNEICVDRKIAIEASEGIQKAQKVSECMNHSNELLLTKTSKDAERSLEIISDALVISAYSEKLIEMKAEALFMLQRYQEVIQLCEQTLDLAEKNSRSIGSNDLVNGWDISKISKRLHFRVWRLSLSFSSYFNLGRLEEGLAYLEKQAEHLPLTERNRNSILESSVPLFKTVQEVVHLKAAGNDSFLAGRHAEAIEHYTAALSCNLESRPFAAICFCNRAAAYRASGQITDAIADCNLAIALDGNYLKAISRRATLYGMIRDYGQAVSDLERLISALNKQVEEKSGQAGGCDRSLSCMNELRQARLHLSEIEEDAKKDIPLDMYLILGVESSVSALEIKKAYRKAALRHHPDKALQFLAKGDSADDKLWKGIAEEVHKDADRLFKMIGEAYAVLSDATKRSRYDLEEEMRNAQKKRGGVGTSKTPKDEQGYPFDKNGSRHQWREVWNNYSNSRPRGSESNRWSRYM